MNRLKRLVSSVDKYVPNAVELKPSRGTYSELEASCDNRNRPSPDEAS